MPHSEKLLQRETLGKNRVFTHERWQVQLENGQTAEREIIRHPGGVGIVAVDERPAADGTAVPQRHGLRSTGDPGRKARPR